MCVDDFFEDVGDAFQDYVLEPLDDALGPLDDWVQAPFEVAFNLMTFQDDPFDPFEDAATETAMLFGDKPKEAPVPSVFDPGAEGFGAGSADRVLSRYAADPRIRKKSSMSVGDLLDPLVEPLNLSL
jgi:hypothetical protein